MTSHHYFLCAPPPRATPLFQLCNRCTPTPETLDDRPGPRARPPRPCAADGKPAAAHRRCCHYKIRV